MKKGGVREVAKNKETQSANLINIYATVFLFSESNTSVNKVSMRVFDENMDFMCEMFIRCLLFGGRVVDVQVTNTQTKYHSVIMILIMQRS